MFPCVSHTWVVHPSTRLPCVSHTWGVHLLWVERKDGDEEEAQQLQGGGNSVCRAGVSKGSGVSTILSLSEKGYIINGFWHLHWA